MKYKLIAFLLALTVASWGQTTNQTSSSQDSKAATGKPACACCDKTKTETAESATEAKAAECCAHHDMAAKGGKEPISCMSKDKVNDAAANAKDEASCCKGKDAASCGSGKDKAAAGCCGQNKCEQKGEKSCCGKKTETTAMNCCKGKKGTIDTSEKIAN